MICMQTLKLFCCEPLEDIEGYAEAMADTERTWTCHHWLEFGATMDELKELGLYYNRPAKELILVPNEYEHCKLPHLGRRRTKEWNENLSKAMMGHTGHSNKGYRWTDEQKKHARESKIGKHRVYRPDGSYYMA